MQVEFTPEELHVVEFALENDIEIVLQDKDYDKQELKDLKSALKKIQGVING